MKNKYLGLMILSLMVAGCSPTNTSSSNSNSNNKVSSSSTSVVSSSSTSTSSSSSSSSTGIDKTGWIEENTEDYAIKNPKKWFYSFDASKVSVTNAMYFEEDGMLFFDFNGEGNYDSINLYYHDTYVLPGENYTTKFSFTSNVAGKITVNGVENDVKIGTQEISVNSKLENGKAAVSIQFGTNNGGLISNNVAVEIGDIYISKVTNVKSKLEQAINSNNYTISLLTSSDTFNGNGYYGEAKFFDNACLFTYANNVDVTSGNVGYAENEDGIFGFRLNEEGNVSPNSYYEKDADNNNLKGLYSTNEIIHLKEFTGDKNGKVCEGIPSLHKLDLSQFDMEINIDEVKTIKDGSSLRYLSYMLDDYFCTFYYSGISSAKVKLNKDDNLEISFNNPYKTSSATFVISNIGTTTDEIVEEFINGDDFAPKAAVEEKPVDPEVEEMVTKINEGNYTVTKPDGTKFYVNDKYSYRETKNVETNEIEINGYINTGSSIFMYEIINNEIVVDNTLDYKIISTSITTNGLDGLISGNTQFFLMNKANKYSLNEEKGYYEYKDTSDPSYLSFSSKWFNLEADGFNYVSLKEDGENIQIGIELTINDSVNYQTLEVSNIGNTSVKLLDDYIASFEEA